jgi:hypothetical protein
MSNQHHFVNVGTSIFYDDLVLQNQKVTQVKWSPLANGDHKLIHALDRLSKDTRVQEANEKAVSIVLQGHPYLIDIGLAKDMIEGFHENLILHAGPPVAWENMCGPMQGAIIGALLYEKKASTVEEAKALVERGTIEFAPAQHYNAVGPMAGVISANMPVHVILNKPFGNKAYCTVNEGLGKVLRFGAYDETVLTRLHWIKDEFMPVLKAALVNVPLGIDLKVLIAQAVQMGDECHNRNKAATSLFFKEIVNPLLSTSFKRDHIQRVISFIQSNDHYFLNLSMPAAKSMLEAAHGVEHSTLVTTMARNGVDFGLRISGLGKQTWFTAPANMVQGLLFAGFSDDDASPDLGDSTITETLGIGGFAMGASPAITQFVGGTVEDAMEYTRSMFAITMKENTAFALPALNFMGTATGIDVLKVIKHGVLPIINSGIAHKDAGVGQIGAGIVSPPMDCFLKVLSALNEGYKEEQHV